MSLAPFGKCWRHSPACPKPKEGFFSMPQACPGTWQTSQGLHPILLEWLVCKSGCATYALNEFTKWEVYVRSAVYAIMLTIIITFSLVIFLIVIKIFIQNSKYLEEYLWCWANYKESVHNPSLVPSSIGYIREECLYGSFSCSIMRSMCLTIYQFNLEILCILVGYICYPIRWSIDINYHLVGLLLSHTPVRGILMCGQCLYGWLAWSLSCMNICM